MLGTLKEVSMPQNGIYTPGCIALSEAFKYNPHLKVINLNDNTVQKKGATAIATVLPALQVLETLNLGDCLLKTEGAISIAKALSNKHLKLQVCLLKIFFRNIRLCKFYIFLNISFYICTELILDINTRAQRNKHRRRHGNN